MYDVNDNNYKIASKPSKATTLAKSSKASSSSAQMCTVDACNKRGVIKCKFCSKVHCIAHRLDIDHNCIPKSSSKKGASSSSSSIGSAILGTYSNMNEKLAELHRQNQERREKRQKLEIAKAVSSGDYQKQSKVLQNSFVNKKGQPIGQSSIEFEDKFPLDVYFPMKSRVPPVHMFFHRNWKLGRVLDQVARQGKIDNKNHLTLDEEKRLNLFNISSTESLEPNKTLQELRDVGALMPNDGVILEFGPVLNPEITDAFQKAVQNPNEAAANCVVM